MSRVYEFSGGTLPLLISVPHAGTDLPDGIRKRLTDTAQSLPDTDWFVDRLYDFAAEMGASVIKANYSRYVIDLNRPPNDTPLYPGQSGTGLCPITLFDGTSLYKEGSAPDHNEIAHRLSTYWIPYHDRLKAELVRLRGIHGKVLLWDGHSIKSFVPSLFEGRLPDLNIGTADGTSCSSAISDRIIKLLRQNNRFSAVLNGRFKGGYITRHYGSPAAGINAVQLEISQDCYMEKNEKPIFLKTKAQKLLETIKALINRSLDSL